VIRSKLEQLLFGAMGLCFLAGALVFRPDVATAADRLTWWAPSTDPLMRAEWRYTAGRITDGDQDFGFIVSLSEIDTSVVQGYALTVQRQDFTGDQNFAGRTYTGTLTYDTPTATYSFKDGSNQELVNWQWDNSVQLYKLTVATAELVLTNVTMIPQGALIDEGGDGFIKAGRIGNVLVNSNYYADWTTLEIGGVEKGVARIDMHVLLKDSITTEVSTDYDHRWFALAADLDDGTPAWVSAWKIEDFDGPYWTVTIATGSDMTWNVLSITEEDEGSLAEPLTVTTLERQNLPASTGLNNSTGKKWHLTAGNNQANDLLDLQITVPEGQFITGNIQTTSDWLEEAVGIQVEGKISDTQISAVRMVAAESTTEFDPLVMTFLPLISKHSP